MSAVLPHLEITPQRPDWLAGAPGFEPGNGGIKIPTSRHRREVGPWHGLGGRMPTPNSIFYLHTATQYSARLSHRACGAAVPQPLTSVIGRSWPSDSWSCQRPSLSSYEMPAVFPGTRCSAEIGRA